MRDVYMGWGLGGCIYEFLLVLRFLFCFEE